MTDRVPNPEKPPTVLLIDDNCEDRDYWSSLLKNEPFGFVVLEATCGDSGFRLFQRQHIDCVVLDLEMPVMDGPTLMLTLRERTKWGRVPLVVVSGTDGAAEAAPRLGARACLNKPFELSDLLHTIEQVAPPS